MQRSAEDVLAIHSINMDTEGLAGVSGFPEPISEQSHRPAYIVTAYIPAANWHGFLCLSQRLKGKKSSQFGTFLKMNHS